MKPKIQIFLLLVLTCTFLFGCSPYRQTSKKEGCGELAKHIEQGWNRGEEKDLLDLSTYFQTNGINLFKELSWNAKCVKGLTMDQVEKIFGHPHSRTETTFNYYVTKNCFSGEGKNGCEIFYFSFDPESRKLINLGMGGTETINN